MRDTGRLYVRAPGTENSDHYSVYRLSFTNDDKLAELTLESDGQNCYE